MSSRSNSTCPQRGGDVHTMALICLFGLLVASLAGSLFYGSVPLDVKEVFTLLFDSESSSLRREIIVNIRLPRAVGGAITGGALALCGVAMQAVIRNPLADPYLMGVSAGASLGATFFLLMVGGMTGFGLSGFAFLGAAGSLLLVLGLSVRSKTTVHRMLLAGIAVNVLCSSLSSILIYLRADAQQLQTVVFWLMGSLAPADWAILPWPMAAVTVGLVFFLGQRRNLNLIMLSDEDAFSLGIHPARYRVVYLIVSACIASSCVAHFGMIGFMGLIVPHIMRFFVGGNHVRLVPFSFLAGSIFMVWIDILARSLVSSEIPLGLITGLLGSPFFFWLLLKPDRQ